MIKDKQKVLALDQSTTATGWAIYVDGMLYDYGVNKASGCLEKRINNMKEWLIDKVNQIGRNNLIIIMEQVQLQNNTLTFNTLSQLQGVLINEIFLLFNEDIDGKLFHYTSSSWKSTCGVKGKNRKEQKENAKNFVLSTFDTVDPDADQDVYDAICLGYHYLMNNREKINFD